MQMLKATEAAELYGISTNSIYNQLRINHKYIKKVDGVVMVDIEPLVRRREFEHKVRKQCLENYFEIVDIISQHRLAIMLACEYGGTVDNSNMFMQISLFSSAYIDKSILSYKIPTGVWQFYRFTNKLLRRQI